MIIPLRLVWVSAVGGTFEPYPQPHVLPQGIDVTYELEVVNELGAPVDITGWTFAYSLKEDVDDVTGVISRAGFIVDAPNGKARVQIAPSDTITQVTPELLPRSGPYVADVKAVRPGPFTEQLLPATPVTLGPPVGTPALVPTPTPGPGAFIAGALQVRVAALVDVPTLSGLLLINGVTLAADNLILLTAQADASLNGIWQAKASAWVRPAAFPAGYAAAGVMVNAQEGTAKQASQWICYSVKPADVIGTDDLFWKEAGGGGGNVGPIGQQGAVDVEDPIGVIIRRKLTQDDLAAPYSITGFSPGFATDLEHGQSIVDPSFTAAYLRPAAAASVQDDVDQIALITAPFTSFAYGVAPLPARTKNSTSGAANASHVWTLRANETGGPTKLATITATWRCLVYYGIGAIPGVFDDVWIKALGGGVKASGFARTIAYGAPGGTFLWYAFPAVFGTPTQFKDAATQFAVPFSLAAAAVPLVNDYLISITGGFDVWRSDNPLASAVTVQVS
jgi:hypothetical protein